MKINRMLHKILILGLTLMSFNSYAGKYDIMVGAYSYSAKVSSKSTTLSGFGTYEAAYLASFRDNFEIMLGYSFTMTGVIGGDYSYGPKLGLNYFPINFSNNEKIQLPSKTIIIRDFFKPYIGIAFNQRQFQSAKTSYAGFGISVGFEKYLNPRFTLKNEVKMNTYSGASEASASEINILVGLVFGL